MSLHAIDSFKRSFILSLVTITPSVFCASCSMSLQVNRAGFSLVFFFLQQQQQWDQKSPKTISRRATCRHTSWSSYPLPPWRVWRRAGPGSAVHRDSAALWTSQKKKEQFVSCLGEVRRKSNSRSHKHGFIEGNGCNNLGCGGHSSAATGAPEHWCADDLAPKNVEQPKQCLGTRKTVPARDYRKGRRWEGKETFMKWIMNMLI